MGISFTNIIVHMTCNDRTALISVYEPVNIHHIIIISGISQMKCCAALW